jgi:hypothetical protein
VGRFEQEGWRVRKDGTRFWAHVVIDPIRDFEGNLVGYAKITRDLSERRRAEEQLWQSQEQLRLLVQGGTMPKLRWEQVDFFAELEAVFREPHAGKEAGGKERPQRRAFTANWLTKLPSLQGKRATTTTPGPEYFLFLSANLQARATVGEKRPSTCPFGLTE